MSTTETTTGGTSPLIVPLTKVPEILPKHGVFWPHSVEAARNAYRNRAHNGLAKGFVTLGGRVCIHVPRFLEAVAELADDQVHRG